MVIKNPGIELINSEHILDAAHIEDHLRDERWLQAFYKRWSLPGRWSAGELKRLRELRTLIRVIVEDLTATRKVSSKNIAELNRFMTPSKVRFVLTATEAGDFDLETKKLTATSVTAQIAQTFSALLAEHDWRRLKVCANKHCRWAFYDASRNRSRRWCDSAACGNMMKVRAFRERQAAVRDRGKAENP